MKLKKLTYQSPLFGSVYCEERIEAPDNRIELGRYGTLQLYNRGDDMMRLLSDRSADLKDFVPEELEELVVKAVFGIDFVDEDGVYLLTEVYTRQDPTAYEYQLLQEWITGQLSDGWGEGLEQQEVLREPLTWQAPYFDEDTCEWTEEEYRADAYYYVHPWCSRSDWYLDLINHEEVELDIPEPEVLTELWHTVLNLKKQIDEIETTLRKFV